MKLMNIILAILIFSMVLFIYMHIYYQFKTSNDNEIYTLEEPQKNRLEEIANLRQPFIFKSTIEHHLDEGNLGDHLNIRTSDNPNEDEELFLPLPLNDATALFNKKSNYITENNHNLSIYKHVADLCDFLQPTLNFKKTIDFWSGSEDSSTPLRFFLNFRNYLYVVEGEVRIKFAKPNTKITHVDDYDYLEFRSTTNPWNEEIADSMEIKATKGDVVFIPAYWWNSVKYGTSAKLLFFQYMTYANAMAVSPHLIRNILQQQNIKHRTLKKMKLELPETNEKKEPNQKTQIHQMSPEKQEIHHSP